MRRPERRHRERERDDLSVASNRSSNSRQTLNSMTSQMRHRSRQRRRSSNDRKERYSAESASSSEADDGLSFIILLLFAAGLAAVFNISKSHVELRQMPQQHPDLVHLRHGGDGSPILPETDESNEPHHEREGKKYTNNIIGLAEPHDEREGKKYTNDIIDLADAPPGHRNRHRGRLKEDQLQPEDVLDEQFMDRATGRIMEEEEDEQQRRNVRKGRRKEEEEEPILHYSTQRQRDVIDPPPINDNWDDTSRQQQQQQEQQVFDERPRNQNDDNRPPPRNEEMERKRDDTTRQQRQVSDERPRDQKDDNPSLSRTEEIARRHDDVERPNEKAPLEVPAAPKLMAPVPEEEQKLQYGGGDGGAVAMPQPKSNYVHLSSAYDVPIPSGPELPPMELRGYKDTWDPYEDTDQPVFWHIPKAGGSTVKDIMGTCHRFVMASEAGVYEGHHQDTEIGVVHIGGDDPSPFVNVDTTTIPGIERAAKMGLANSGLADFITTPFIHESEQLFNPTARGRLFTVFRHPVDRAVSLFYYLQVADWEPTYNPDLANWSLEQYGESDIIENNWMVRQLTNSYEGDLTQQHLVLAMDIIRRKFLVGLLTEKRRTMDRVEKFFRFKYRVMPTNQEKCREQLLTGGSNANDSTMKKIKPKPGDPAYELIARQNHLDIRLYQYIERVFEEQEQFVRGVPDDYRNLDATCAKCVPPTFPPPLPPVTGVVSGGNMQASQGERIMISTSTTPVATADGVSPNAMAKGGGTWIEGGGMSPTTTAMSANGGSLPLPYIEPPPIGPDLDGYKDTMEPYDETDSMVFWHIPKAGGSTVKDILGTCHRFVMASEAGVYEGHDADEEIGVVHIGGDDPSPFVNVDTTTIPGLIRAKRLGLAKSGLADVIVTPYIKEAERLFDFKYRGRFFTVFRHPVDRAVSLFYYLQVAHWEPTYKPDLVNWDISDYARSPLIENNWMVRQLSGVYTGDLKEKDLAVAKDIIRRKFLVGLLHEKERTMDRVEKFFRLKYHVMPENQERCREKLLKGGSNKNEVKKEKPKKGDETWELVAWQNMMDIKLYEYIEQLFEEQEALVADIPDGYRNINATCAKCVPPTFPYKERKKLMNFYNN